MQGCRLMQASLCPGRLNNQAYHMLQGNRTRLSWVRLCLLQQGARFKVRALGQGTDGPTYAGTDSWPTEGIRISRPPRYKQVRWPTRRGSRRRTSIASWWHLHLRGSGCGAPLSSSWPAEAGCTSNTGTNHSYLSRGCVKTSCRWPLESMRARKGLRSKSSSAGRGVPGGPSGGNSSMLVSGRT